MALQLRTKDGTLLDVPDTLKAITTYVLLEQERWFEKEIDFLLALAKPDMTAIDIGANLGAYALPLARRVRRVVAYEPGSVARAHLETSRTLNLALNLKISPAAVSDSVRQGRLALGGSSELNQLGAKDNNSDNAEPVAITALDHEDREHDWSPDFIKLDAEGEELNIIEGGRSFFTRHSPLVMFELRIGDEVNTGATTAFAALGYRPYRSLPTAALLVPCDSDSLSEPWELNCFAAKPDRAADLAAQGFLLDAVRPWSPDRAAREAGLALLKAQMFSTPFSALFDAPVDPTYRDALAGYAAWRMSREYGALAFAVARLKELCESAPTMARLTTFARVANEAGRRSLAIKCLDTVGETLRRGDGEIAEPFWAPSPHAETTAHLAEPWDWFITAMLEQKEFVAHHSTYWNASGVNLELLAGNPWVSTDILRRHTLNELWEGRLKAIPERLCHPAPDHLNATVWRSGQLFTTAKKD